MHKTVALHVSLFLAVVATWVLFCQPAMTAAVERGSALGAPTLISYQGYVTDSAGDPYDGLADVQVRLYGTESSSTVLWEELHDNATIGEGYFTILLGSVTPLSAGDFDGAERWIQVSVDLGSGYVDFGRQRVAAVPYALQAQKAASAPWSGLTGVPSSFPPEAHGHTWGSITDEPVYTTRWATWSEVISKPLTFPPELHVHAWADITGEPDFTTRWPAWSEVTDKPSTFPPESHGHAWSDITGEPAYTTRWAVWEEVGNKPTQYPPTAHNHDNRYYTEAELSNPSGGGMVHWNNVANVDYNTVQARVTGSCASGFYVRSVNANGTVNCEEVEGVPSGTIVMWSGSIASIPSGWVLCNGSNGTPDLRDRFIVGAGSSYSVADTGGEASHTLTISEMPSHNHGGSTSSSGNHRHSMPNSTHSGDGLAHGSIHHNNAGVVYTDYAGSHSHTISSQGGGNAHENRPPYYALAFIMKQ
jgi:microcystin-dependent protein